MTGRTSWGKQTTARIVVSADDLTGAADTGIQFTRLGFRVRVRLAPSASDRDIDVDVRDTNSRSLSPDRAAASVAAGVAEVRQARLYKKIDSTLRGNVGAESEALLRASGRACALVAPAYPATGRTTVRGRVLVQGVPVNQTALANDPAHPIRHAAIARVLRDQSRLPVAHLGLRLVRGDPRELEDAIGRAEGFVIADATTDQDLLLLAHAVGRNRTHVLPVGSAGLARQLAYIWRLELPTVTSCASLKVPSSPILVVVGTQNPVTRRQVEALQRSGLAIIDPFERGAVARACAALDRRSSAAIVVPPAPGAAPDRIAGALAATISDLLDRHRVGAIVATGGDTARAILARHSAAAIDLVCELYTGVALGEIAGGALDGTVLVTKAGGFGEDATLLDIVRILESGVRDRG